MSRKDLANNIWKTFDIMRSDDGTTGIMEYTIQISWMIFLKFFEDLENRIDLEYKLADKKYDKIFNDEFQWSNWTKINANNNEILRFVNEKLFPFAKNLKGSIQRELVSILFKEVENNMIKSSYNFKDIVEIIDQIDFSNLNDSHIVSQIYEESLLKLGKEGGHLGEFYTPRSIVRFIIKIIDPKIGNTIFDPFCGSCGFIIESYKYIKERENLTAENFEILRTNTFYGQERKRIPHILGIMNCILHGLFTPRYIKRKNTLEDNNRNISESKKHDIIITNPPFGGVENKQIQQNFVYPSQSTELLALQYVMKHLKSNGKCGIILPEGLLTRIGDNFTKVKKELLENFNVHTIISLPVGVFANVSSAGMGPKTNIVFFDNNHKNTDNIWYYELKIKEGRNYTKINTITDADLDDCLKKWKIQDISDNSWVVDVKSIFDKECDLSAKNPNTKNKIKYTPPQELLVSILDKEKEIQKTLEELQSLLD